MFNLLILYSYGKYSKRSLLYFLFSQTDHFIYLPLKQKNQSTFYNRLEKKILKWKKKASWNLTRLWSLFIENFFLLFIRPVLKFIGYFLWCSLFIEKIRFFFEPDFSLIYIQRLKLDLFEKSVGLDKLTCDIAKLVLRSESDQSFFVCFVLTLKTCIVYWSSVFSNLFLENNWSDFNTQRIMKLR